MSNEPIQKIDKVVGKTGTSHVQEPIKATGHANKAHFDAALQNKQPEHTQVAKAGEEGKKTIFDEAKATQGKVDPTQKADVKDIQAELTKTREQIAKTKQDLQGNELDEKTFKDFKKKLKPYKKLMRNKLTHVEEGLSAALSKAGSDEIVTSDAKGKKGFSPVDEFLGRLSHIEYQMEDMGNYLDYMANSGVEMSPANMLAIQMKVTHIGQEVEFFAALLNKSLESAKTIMNVQV